ncbi:MAG: RusA family crossover junction endodeoxyribonuclease [Neisseriales bacterium]|nr:MAG: RusA family crossover junction endodeoxyribonuclease [Neisseriales bacterium]
MIKFTIQLNPVTKKNHSQIIFRNGKPRLIPSKQYLQYEKDAGWFVNGNKAPAGRLNIKAIYHMAKQTKVDITNLHSALHDVLVKFGVIQDDSWQYVGGTDGSRVMFDPVNPRTEVTITVMPDEVQND